MIDALILLTIAALAWIGWLLGMLRTRAQLWVRFIGPIGIAWMTWYFFVALGASRATLIAGDMQAGHLTVAFMVGGIWALLAHPKPPEKREDDARKADAKGHEGAKAA